MIMNEIINKIEALRSAGFEPMSVMMTQVFFDDLTNSLPKMVRADRSVWDNVPNSIHGLPIKIKEPSHILYSIEVA